MENNSKYFEDKINELNSSIKLKDEEISILKYKLSSTTLKMIELEERINNLMK